MKTAIVLLFAANTNKPNATKKIRRVYVAAYFYGRVKYYILYFTSQRNTMPVLYSEKTGSNNQFYLF